MAQAPLALWRLNPTTGFWAHERAVTSETAAQWLAVYQADAPGARFVVSRRKPRA